MKNRIHYLALALVFLLSSALFLATKEAWRREPPLELAVLSVVAIAAIKALESFDSHERGGYSKHSMEEKRKP